MIFRLPKSRDKRPWKLLLGLFCLLLVVLSGTAQVAHTHPGGDISHADCSLCATAHVVAQAASHPVPVPATLVVAKVPEAAPERRRPRLPIFALFTRPPPSISSIA